MFKTGLAFNREKFDKSKYRGLEFNGYVWSCRYADGTHMFVKIENFLEPPYRKYYEMRCTDEQITNGDAEFMSQHNLTYAGSPR